jgi:methyl-accepting chemotaxis protein
MDINTSYNNNADLGKELAGQLESFNELRQSISSNIWDIKSVDDVNNSYILEMVQAAENNMKSISTCHNELEGIIQSSKKIVHHVENSIKQISNTKGSSRMSLEAMREATDALEQMEEHFQVFRQLLIQVERSTGKILTGIASIEDVSTMTNILALNASIVAARAGVHGKGFKVVAREVRKLADQTKSLTDETIGSLKELKKYHTNTFKSLEEYEKIKNTVHNRVVSTEKELSRSFDSLQTVDAEIKGINDLVHNQSTGTGEIYSQVSQINSSAELLVYSSRHIISNLNNQSDIINEIDNEAEAIRRYAEAQEEKLISLNVLKRDKSIIRIGHDVAYPPWVYIAGGKSAGLSVEVVKKLFEELESKIAFQANQWESVMMSLLENKIELILNVGWPNEFFSDKPVIATLPYAQFEVQVFFSKHGMNGLLPLTELKGKKIAMQKGSYVGRYIKKYGCRIIEVENDIQGIVQLIWHKVDGIVTEKRVGNYLSKKFFQGDIVPATDVLDRLDVVFILHEDNTKLRDSINEILSREEISREIASSTRSG